MRLSSSWMFRAMNEDVITAHNDEAAAVVSGRNSNKRSHLKLAQWPLLLLLIVVAPSASGQSEETSPQTTTTTTPSSTHHVTSPESIGELDPTLASTPNSTQHKLKPINFTLVDEIFAATLSEEDVVKRWRRMDSQLQDGMKSILKMIFPQIVAISQDAKVSGDCSGGILKWILSLRNLRSWAIKMLDATGKPTAGVFEGSLSMLGNYRQCLNIRAPDEDEIEITEQFEEYFRGQYCVLHLKPWMPVKRPFYHLNESFEFLLRKNYKYYEKTLYDELAEIAVAFNFIDIRMDLCVPSTCSVADIQRVAELLSKSLEMRAKVMRCDIATRDTSPVWARLDQTTYLWLAVPLALITLSLISTLLVCLGFKSRVVSCRGLRQSHFCPSIVEQQQAATATTSNERGNKLFTLFQSLSIQQSTTKQQVQVAPPLDKTKTTPVTAAATTTTQISQVPGSLLGLRNIFVIWFIIVQMTVELKYQYLRESLGLRNMILTYWPFQIIINSTLLFEALIVISAFMYSYACLDFSAKNLVGYLVKRYVSLMLAIVSVIALTIVTPILAIESPVWRNFVEDQADTCKSTGYVNLFFLQNFITSYDKICLPHTWLFCVELQLIVLVVPLLLDLRRNFVSLEGSLKSEADIECSTKRSLIRTIFARILRSNAGLLAVLLIMLGYFVNFVLVYSHQLPASWFYSYPDPDQKNYYFGTYLIKTWTHLSSFIIGLLAGHISRSHVQLWSNRHQSKASSTIESSPNLSQSPQLSHGSTSTIMTMEMSQTNLHQPSSTTSRTSQSSRRKFSRLLTPPPMLALVVVMLATIMCTFSWSTQAGPAPFVAAFYDATSRLVWSLALSALMYVLCREHSSGRSGLAARLLEHPLSTSLGRISPVAYLVAPYVNTFVLAVEEQSLFPSMFIMFHVILGNVAIIYTLALIVATVIQRPVMRFMQQV